MIIHIYKYSYIYIGGTLHEYIGVEKTKKLIDYTKVISENITLGSRVYKQEDNEFYEKSKREASKYE